MTFSIFARGFWLQTRIVLFLFIAGSLIGLLAMSFGLSPKTIIDSSKKLQTLSEPLKEGVSKVISGNNEHSWVFYLFGNGLADVMFLSTFFMASSVKTFHENNGVPGLFTSTLLKFTGWYLGFFNLNLNSSPSFRNLAMLLSFPSVVGMGFLAFSFGSFSVSGIKMTSLLFYLAAIVPHGIFEIPSAVASGAMPLAMLIEIVRQKRENADADTWQIARQLAFSRFTGIILAVIFAGTLMAAIMEGHYTGMIFEHFFLPAI